MGELTRYYDLLLTALKDREVLIKQRIRHTLDHYGNDARVQFESFDYSKE